jgi:hypothetical protein
MCSQETAELSKAFVSKGWKECISEKEKLEYAFKVKKKAYCQGKMQTGYTLFSVY